MKKRTMHITALGDGVNVKVQATVYASRHLALTDDELDKLKSSLTREVADALGRLPYTDFGIDNITVY